MHRVGTTHGAQRARGAGAARLAGTIAIGAAAVMGLAACTSAKGDPPASSAATSAAAGTSAPATTSAPTTQSSSKPAAAAAVISTSAADGQISPADPVSVKIANGTLTAVRLTNPAGKVVSGKLAGDAKTWTSTEDLGYSKTYTLTASGKNADGVAVTKKDKVTTLTPDNMTQPYLYRIGNYPLSNGATYGVAIVPVVHFDESITDKAAAQRALSVTTTPHVNGSWSWTDDQDVHYRPQGYWPSGTKVTVSAKVYGVQVGKGLYGQSDVSTSFTVGRKQTTIAYDTAPKSVNKVRVYNAAGQVIRTMNTSMGKHSGQTVNGNYINYYTLDGTYTVLAHEQPAKMCSASYGLPADAPGGYPCEKIYNATKISIDGIYLHELLTTIWSQDHGYDVSHGCLNLNASNSMWFFKHSMVGDPVVIHGAKGAPTLQVWQGGDWTVPWSTWTKNSAL